MIVDHFVQEMFEEMNTSIEKMNISIDQIEETKIEPKN